MSVDGKIADIFRAPARFSSAQDLVHLETQIARADAVLFGAGTLRAYGTCLPIRQPELMAQRRRRGQPEQPIQVVCSPGGQLDPKLRFFQQPVPRWLLTTQVGALASGDTVLFERVMPCLSQNPDWAEVLKTLFQLRIRHLAVLGGGTLVGALIHQDLVDELYLTLCPLLLGGATAPTPGDGIGVPVDMARRLQLVSAEPVGDEVFLHYRRCNTEKD